MARALAVALAAIVACSPPPPPVESATPTRETGVLTVAALLDLSGSHSTLGTAQRNALQLWLDRQGPPLGHFPLKLRVVDVGDSDAKMLIELRRAAVDEPVNAVIVGTPIAYDDVLRRAIGIAALPVLFTLPLAEDPLRGPGGGWSYALAPPLDLVAAMTIDDAASRGVISPSLILARSRDRLDPYASALEGALERRGLAPAERAFVQPDGSLPAALEARLDALRSVQCAVSAALCASLARMAAARAARTALYLTYLTVPAEVGDQRELASRAIWPGSRALVRGLSSVATSARADFAAAYSSRYGPAGTQAATAYDALTLLSLAADRAGAADPERLRSALDTLTMPLIATTYRFAPDRHSGADPADLALLRWSGSTVDVAPVPTAGPRITTAPRETP